MGGERKEGYFREEKRFFETDTEACISYSSKNVTLVVFLSFKAHRRVPSRMACTALKMGRSPSRPHSRAKCIATPAVGTPSTLTDSEHCMAGHAEGSLRGRFKRHSLEDAEGPAPDNQPAQAPQPLTVDAAVMSASFSPHTSRFPAKTTPPGPEKAGNCRGYDARVGLGASYQTPLVVF